MKKNLLLLLLPAALGAQKIAGVQFFNPKTNDETPIIALGEQMILRFDDLENKSTLYRYTLKHLDRNWQEDNLFYSEYAAGPLNGVLDRFEYSFNTLQKYTHYEMAIPNEQVRLKISGNYELTVYQNSAERPVMVQRFSVYEPQTTVGVEQSRLAATGYTGLNQRVQVRASATNGAVMDNVSSFTLTVLQNNNWATALQGIRPTTVDGASLLFQDMNLAFPGNNEFYYFDNKNINAGFDMVANGEIIDGVNHTYLHPMLAYSSEYAYQPDVNGAFYPRRSDLGIERNADREADYSWVRVSLPSQKFGKNIYVVGLFNQYRKTPEGLMKYDEAKQAYVADIYLKQGFYNYTLATEQADGSLSFGEINGNFWQTENLYQALLYYRPFGRNYDGILGYGELRKEVR